MQFDGLNKTRFFVKDRWDLSNFWHLICYNFCYILRKLYFKIIFFRSLTLVSENTPKIISIAPLITEKQSFKKIKTLPVSPCFISKIKKADVFKFLPVKCFVKRFLFLKIWNARVNYCGSYGSLNLLYFDSADLT